MAADAAAATGVSALELGRSWAARRLWLRTGSAACRSNNRGRENIPQGACIVACKHQSTWGNLRPCLPIVFPEYSYILKRELIHIPFFFGCICARPSRSPSIAPRAASFCRSSSRSARALFAQNPAIVHFYFRMATRRPAGAPPEYKSAWR